MKLTKLIHYLKKTEKIILAFLFLILLVSGYQIGKAFYLDNTEIEYINGGVYVEGAVGKVDILNPLFVQQGTVTQDITELIFSGLTKFDTATGTILGELADFKVDESGKKYTFVLKENAKWHDGQPVTTDDVIFTYENVIKNPDFSGNILNYNDFSGIKVTKIDDRTVDFVLEKPDAFFLVKTTVGLLPKHILENESVKSLRSAPFNFNPVGTGPYRYVSQLNFPDHQEYNLESFSDFYNKEANIKTIIIRVYTDEESLQKNISGLDGIRTIPEELHEIISKKSKYKLVSYELPQYVAIFINNQAPKLKANKLRLGLKLGTDKAAIVKAVGGGKIIDTPLLEINDKDWVNQYSIKKANGALFETDWQVPNKDSLKDGAVIEAAKIKEKSEEKSPTAAVTYITSPNEGKDLATTSDPLTIAGKVPAEAQKVFVGDYQLQKFKPGDTTWTYAAATKFDSLKEGKNVYEVFVEDKGGKKTMIDAITITFAPPNKEKKGENEKEQLEAENTKAADLPTRVNKEGEKLVLKMITSQNPANYSQIAEMLKDQWKKIGVELQIEVLENEAFQQRLTKRDYDLLLFGQNLGYNLDAYPYWHSSQAKEGGLNLSQYNNWIVDSLLAQARVDTEKERQETLKEIQKIISEQVPAIFLYRPTYYTALSKDIQYPEFKFLATTSDRLASLQSWYANFNRHLKPGVNPLTFLGWVKTQL